MGPELAVFRSIIELFWPTLCLAKMAILNTVDLRSLVVGKDKQSLRAHTLIVCPYLQQSGAYLCLVYFSSLKQSWISKLREAQDVWKKTLQTTVFKGTTNGPTTQSPTDKNVPAIL